MANIRIPDNIECPILPDLPGNECSGELITILINAVYTLQSALINQITPAGTIQWSACPPEERPKGFILADGSWYSPETFPRLFQCIKYHYGRRTDNCFRVPDLRATSIRGMDMGRNCLSDLNEWTSFTELGGQTTGDEVGAHNTYTFTKSGNVNEKEMLLTPLISTGEVCL